MARVQDCPEVPVGELADRGYIQEANRLFFHPLGLALAYTRETEPARRAALRYMVQPVAE